MKAALFCYSRQGLSTARRIRAFLGGWEVRAFTLPRLAEGDFAPLPAPGGPLYARLFAWAGAMIFVGSCGIAVRAAAPCVRDKRTDPAVISVDELGQFVIPLLSGHIGGANRLALELAAALEAVPVVTTATDINRRFSVDAWAAGRGFAIGSMELAKAFSAAILERDLPVVCDFPVKGPLPPGLFFGETGELGLYIGARAVRPFARTLAVIPPVLRLGIGCRKGIAKEAVLQAIDAILLQNQLDQRGVRAAASIDLKADEIGLLEACRQNGWPISFYSAEQLAAVPGAFTPSEFVRKTTGVDNVCERAALIGGGRPLVKKTALSGVTVAVAEEALEVCFE